MVYCAFFTSAYAFFLLVYFVGNGVCSWVCRGEVLGSCAAYRIQTDRPTAPGQVRREIRLSVLNLGFFALTATIGFAAYRHGLTQVYTDLNETSWAYFAASVLLMMAVHETYFYWAHRLMHWKPLFRRFHRVHHLSHAPTAWAGYAFHPVEGLLMAGNLLLYPLLFPVHPLAVVVFLLVQNAYSTVGHSGYDFFPRWYHRQWFLLWHNTPTHHDDHHRYVNGNFGHYVNLWDRLMGTELPQYQRLRDAQPARPFPHTQDRRERTRREVRPASTKTST